MLFLKKEPAVLKQAKNNNKIQEELKLQRIKYLAATALPEE